MRLFGFYSIDPEELVVVAPPVVIKREWRVVVANNKVIAGSEYNNLSDDAWSGVQKLPEEVSQYAQGILDSVTKIGTVNRYYPDPVWTIDICESETGLKVVEVGSFSCAGMFACDPEPIIAEVNRITEDR